MEKNAPLLTLQYRYWSPRDRLHMTTRCERAATAYMQK